MANTWSAFPFVRISAAFILGILIAYHFSMPTAVSAIMAAILVFLSLVYVVNSYRNPNNIRIILISVLATFIIVLSGIARYRLNDQISQNSHFKNYLNRCAGWSGTILSVPKEKTNFYLYEVSIDAILTIDTSFTTVGKFNFYVRKDSLARTFQYGDRIIVPNRPFELPDPKNPNEFNYAKYMRTLHIQHQQFVNYEQVLLIENKPPNQVMAKGIAARLHLQSLISKHIKGKSEKAVLLALLIGDKDQLEKDIVGAYSAAGAMHVLAVSGLHVGIVYLVLLKLLSFLKKSRPGQWLLMLILLSFLWGYALVTGFSPSVLRAVTMFSLVIISTTFSRKSNVYNTIALSAFILLLYEPNLIFSVGFQLSYAAVFGIIYLQPKIYNWWIPTNPILDWCWKITAVSIAAQTATFPLGLYYFHQFPTYFIFSNLLVIPAVAVILYGGVVFLVVGSFSDIAGSMLGKIIEFKLTILNKVVLATELLPGSLISRIYIDFYQLLLLFLMIVAILAMLRQKHILQLIIMLLISSIWAVNSFHKTNGTLSQNFIQHFMVRNNFAFDIVNKGEAKLISSSEFINSELATFQIDPYRMANLLPSPRRIAPNLPVNHSMLRNGIEIWQWNGVKIMRITELLDWQKGEILSCNQLILGGNAIRAKEDLIYFEYDHLIIDDTFKNRKLAMHLSQLENCTYLPVEGSVRLSFF